MKEATGEASMTGITIGVIAIISIVAVPIVRNIINNVTAQTCCSSMGGIFDGSGSAATCKIKKADGTGEKTTTSVANIKKLCS